LLTGDLASVEVILDHLPIEAIKLDHGAGFSLVASLHALGAALPLPRELADTARWLARSPEERTIRAWVGEHGKDLGWVEADGVYRFVCDVQP